MPSTKTLFLYYLGSQSGIGNSTLSILAEHLQDPSSSLADLELQSILLPENKKIVIKKMYESFDEAILYEELSSSAIDIISLCDEDYPKLLREIHQPPAILFLRGSRENLKKQSISLVGTRKPTRYGIDVARTLSRELANAGFVTISGMALGIDAEVHRGTLDAQGQTIAVLGNGLADSQIYPRAHFQLMQSLLQSGGSVLSELWPNVPASTGTFPARNRIISGLSMATVIIEASEKSGTLITARFALEQNREVFAVPGSLFSKLSEGPHQLIRSGAHIVTCTQDILDVFPSSPTQLQEEPSRKINLSAEESSILTALEIEPKDRQDLCHCTKLTPAKLAINLTFLEMKGFIKDIGNGLYRKI
ncbi:MAG: DNA-protecting protein DprA [Candidatus Moraniibacteriota bacterium]|nr:MAG: DNA-protecting protein DprA [Candidatus Moranbacteria bacterium]